MGIEIERKFLVNKHLETLLPTLGTGVSIRQGYLNMASNTTVRVRLIDQQAFLTIKGEREGIRRPEFEYEIPKEDGEELLLLCQNRLVEKIRYTLAINNIVWELDVFKALNLGLIIAEVELEDEAQFIPLPDWVGEEVSEDPRYFNGYLADTPFSTWS